MKTCRVCGGTKEEGAFARSKGNADGYRNDCKLCQHEAQKGYQLRLKAEGRKCLPCTVEGCDMPIKARSWCDTHWARWKRTGSPTGSTAKSPLERLMGFVEPTDTCWEWRGLKDEHGYGRFSFNGRLRQAHRVSYVLLVGSIPKGLQLDHLCRNKGCVNPKHLEPVTHGENLRRGNNRNRVKTHCVHGHPFDLFNTVFDERGHRQCKVCKDSIKRAYQAKRERRGLGGRTNGH